MSQSNRRIAVVDDDASIRKALERFVRSHGFDVETFAGAEQFLAGAEPRMPECLILDVRMPGMSGLELQEALGRAGRHVPIVFITAHDDEQARRKALAAGAVAFLKKPFDDQALLHALERAIAHGESPLVIERAKGQQVEVERAASESGFDDGPHDG